MAIDLTKISQLPPGAAPLTGNEQVPMVQAGGTVRMTSRDFVLPTDPLVVFAAVGALTAARVLTQGSGVVFNTSVAGQFIISVVSAGGAGPIVYGNRISAVPGATEDDYNPTGWDQGLDKNGLSLTPPGGGTTISGIDTTAVVDGQAFQLANMSDTDTITLLHESVLSAANNRFHLPLLADMTLQVGQMVTIMYETDTNRLRVSV